MFKEIGRVTELLKYPQNKIQKEEIRKDIEKYGVSESQ